MMRRATRGRIVGIVVAGALLAACSTTSSTTGTSTSSTAAAPATTSAPELSVTLLAAGDIADCKLDGDTRTAALLDGLPGPIAALGDLAYENGTTTEFANCYTPTWGRFIDRTNPVAGNHEYNTKNAAPYYAYFGTRAGTSGQGWYSYNLGRWHLIALNSNCAAIGGCTSDSPQGKWLAADIAANSAKCTLAYWHHPRWSSGPHGPTETMQPIWNMLAAAGADLVLSGHDHHYERFAPMNADGTVASTGLRQFVVGTGGRTLYPTVFIRPGSEIRDSNTFGVLQLDLAADSYAWKFHPVDGETFTDSGTARCA